MEELINEAKNGDEEAFTKIIIALEKDLYRIARMRFSSEDDICEVVQQTIIASFYNIKKLKNVEYFKTWIIKILLNKCNKFSFIGRQNSEKLIQIPLAAVSLRKKSNDLHMPATKVGTG